MSFSWIFLVNLSTITSLNQFGKKPIHLSINVIDFYLEKSVSTSILSTIDGKTRKIVAFQSQWSFCVLHFFANLRLRINNKSWTTTERSALHTNFHRIHSFNLFITFFLIVLLSHFFFFQHFWILRWFHQLIKTQANRPHFKISLLYNKKKEQKLRSNCCLSNRKQPKKKKKIWIFS